MRDREKALRDADKLEETSEILIGRLVDEEVERRSQEITEVLLQALLQFIWLK